MHAPTDFLTAPLGIRATGAAVYNFQRDWIRVASVAYSIVGAVGLRLDKFDAFTTRKIVVKIPWQGRPELEYDQRRRWISKLYPYLRVIVPIWCRKISTKSSSSRIFAEQRVRCTKGIACCTKHWIRPACRDTVFCAQTIEAEATGSAAGQPEMSGSLR
jgi:hypothetical protein